MEKEPTSLIRVNFAKKKIPHLKELLSDEEVSDFYRFIQTEKLRPEAHNRIEEQLARPAVVIPFRRD